MRAVASLNSASPSISVVTTRGTPRRRNTAVAARASVGATIAPSAKAAAQPISGTRAWATAATATIVTSTSPTESLTMGHRFARRSRIGVSNAAPNSSGGRNTSRTSSGSRAMCGSPGSSPSTTPPTTNSAGYGSANRRATSYRNMITTSAIRSAPRISKGRWASVRAR